MKGKNLQLKYLREKCGDRQQDFGKIIGVSATQYAKKENGKADFTLTESYLLREYINKKLGIELTVDQIFLQQNFLLSSETIVNKGA